MSEEQTYLPKYVNKETVNGLFETICLYKDSHSSNLNKLFSSYRCDTLEAKVPVVSNDVVNKLLEVDQEQQLYGTLALKSRAAQGRQSRTKDKSVRLVEINGETVIETSGQRDRSPVDLDELDVELEEYMKERARRKNLGTTTAMDLSDPPPAPTRRTITLDRSTPSTSTATRPALQQRIRNRSSNRDDSEELPSSRQLDDDLDQYMMEAARVRTQRRTISEQVDRMSLMEDMDKDQDPDNYISFNWNL